MDTADSSTKQHARLMQIVQFVQQTSGLSVSLLEETKAQVRQNVDGKMLVLTATDLDGVILRSDAEGRDFIQVNFASGQKLLLTDSLIGFRPAALTGLDLSRLPKVVTTPDIGSVFEAIQESLQISDSPQEEVQVLRRVFESLVAGGEAVGFDLTTERTWIRRLPTTVFKVTA